MATEPVWKTHLAADSVFDPQYHQSARAEVVSFLNDPPGVVLDVGCGGGATGKLIKEKFPGTRVIGIELNPHAADHARRVIDDVICESVDTVDLPQLLPDIRIDTVLLLDVLEHLYDPWRTLVRLRRWLTAGARVLASVPNIRNLSNLDELAAGRWEYAPNGVLDVTHLRFFTRSTLKRMFDPLMQVLRPISPLAWLPLGLVLFRKSEPAALFAIAICCKHPCFSKTCGGIDTGQLVSVLTFQTGIGKISAAALLEGIGA